MIFGFILKITDFPTFLFNAANKKNSFFAVSCTNLIRYDCGCKLNAESTGESPRLPYLSSLISFSLVKDSLQKQFP